jgi:hypothetical protein
LGMVSIGFVWSTIVRSGFDLWEVADVGEAIKVVILGPEGSFLGEGDGVEEGVGEGEFGKFLQDGGEMGGVGANLDVAVLGDDLEPLSGFEAEGLPSA